MIYNAVIFIGPFKISADNYHVGDDSALHVLAMVESSMDSPTYKRGDPFLFQNIWNYIIKYIRKRKNDNAGFAVIQCLVIVRLVHICIVMLLSYHLIQFICRKISFFKCEANNEYTRHQFNYGAINLIFIVIITIVDIFSFQSLETPNNFI